MTSPICFPVRQELACISRFAFRCVCARDAFVTLQPPLAIRTFGQPIGDADLRIDLTGGHGDARLIAGGNDLLKTELAVAENSDKGNEHDGPLLTRYPGHFVYAAIVPRLNRVRRSSNIAVTPKVNAAMRSREVTDSFTRGYDRTDNPSQFRALRKHSAHLHEQPFK